MSLFGLRAPQQRSCFTFRILRLYLAQVDLDLGNYERFLDITLTRDNNLTTGKVYQVATSLGLCDYADPVCFRVPR